MLVLGIDSSTAVAGLALVEKGSLLGEVFSNVGKTHAARLLPLLDMLLKESGRGLGELGGIAVTTGPGSFTGLRIGLATAKALAFASGLPLAGVPTLDALARNLPGSCGTLCPVLKARRGQFYAALYSWREEGLARLTPYEAPTPQELLARLEALEGPLWLLGEGAGELKPLLTEQLGARTRLAPPSLALPRAAEVAFAGLERLAAGLADNPADLKPIYVLPSAAEAKLLSG